MNKTTAILLAATALQLGCGADDTGTDSLGPAPVEYALTANPYTALQQVWAPLEPSPAVRAAMNDRTFTVYQHTEYAAHGLGARLAQGVPWTEHLELAPGFPGEGAERKSLAYIWVVADPQIIDEESPIRMDRYDKVYRPHGQLTPQLFEAHVRTARRISERGSRPFDFAILAGDLTDTSQKNELDWLITALNGGVIDPDSGADDDPDPGPGNDYNDPFVSVGVDIPWYAALGNHDILHVGGFGLIDATLRDAALGDHLYTDGVFSRLWGGYVAGNTIDHQVIVDDTVITPPDTSRLPLYETELLQALHDAGGAPAGHGFTQADVDSNKGYYSVHPILGKPIRMIVLDSTDAGFARPGLAQQGSMDLVQYEWLEQELLSAAADDEVVIVVTHHRLDEFHSKSEVPAATLETLLKKSENVILHLVGHGHQDAQSLKTVSGDDGYWELMSASTIDFPLQSRIVEVVDEGNGYLSIYVTNCDHNSAPNTLADKARQMAAGRLAFGTTFFDGDTVAFWAEESQLQNLLLRVELPASISNKLASYDDWPRKVESVDTLAKF